MNDKNKIDGNNTINLDNVKVDLDINNIEVLDIDSPAETIVEEASIKANQNTSGEKNISNLSNQDRVSKVDGLSSNNSFTPSDTKNGMDNNSILNSSPDSKINASNNHKSNNINNSSNINNTNNINSNEENNLNNDIENKDNLNKNKNGIKDRINNTKDNIKEKVNDTKNNINNAKDKAKNFKNKADDFKNKSKTKDGRNDLKNKLKNSAKNKGKNLKDRAKNAAKNKVKDKVNNAKDNALDKINDVKDKIDKAKKVAEGAKKAAKGTIKVAKGAFKAIKAVVNFFVATFPVSAIAVGVVLLIFLIVVMIGYMMPGVFGDVKEDDNYYIEKDKKTLENKLRNIFESYSLEENEVAMATVLFPYFAELHDGNVTSYLSQSDNEDETDPDKKLKEDIEDEELSSAELPSEGDNEEDEPSDENDKYLLPFRSSKIRGKLKTLLKEVKKGEDGYKAYLKETYFKKDKGYGDFKKYEGEIYTGYKGYKSLFKSAEDSDYEELANAIINNIYDIKDEFANYIYDQLICSSSSESIGYINNSLIQGEVYVIVGGNESNPIPLKKYVIGTVTPEVGGFSDQKEAILSHMVAAKSFVVGRHISGLKNQTTIYNGGTSPKYEDGKMYVYIQAGTIDQSYVEPDQSTYDKYSSWYDEIAGVFLWDTYAEGFAGAYCSDFGVCGFCTTAGSCMSQYDSYHKAQSGRKYDDILLNYEYNSLLPDGSQRFALLNVETQQLSAVSGTCSDVGSISCGLPNEEFNTFDQTNYEDSYCNLEGQTIKTSGDGVTTMATVIKNLTDYDITPVTTMNDAKASNKCLNIDSSYFEEESEKYGLTFKKLENKDDSKLSEILISELRKANLVIAKVGVGKFTDNENGYYIVIRRTESDGTVSILDPNGNKFYNEHIKISDITTSLIEWYSFSSPKSDEIAEEYCKIGADGDFQNGSGHVAAYFTRSDGKKSIIVNQCTWSYLCGNCNTGVAVAIVSLAKGISENEVINIINGFQNRSDLDLVLAYDYGGRSGRPTTNFFKKYNMKYNPTVNNKTAFASNYQQIVRDELPKGNYIALWFSMPTSSSGITWTGKYHWLGIVGYRNINGKEEIAIADTGHGNSGWYDIDIFKNVTSHIGYLKVIEDN